MKQFIITRVLAHFRMWARIALFIHKPTIIGITGSVGKSSARNAIYAILKDNFPTKVIEKGNSETGVPLGILGLSPSDYSIGDWVRLIILSPFHIFNLQGTQYLIVEMGVDEPNPPKNMEYLLTIVKPDIAVFLNVHAAHTMQFDSTVSSDIVGEKRLPLILKNIAKEKGKIITESGCKVAIYNSDDEYVTAAVEPIQSSKILRFGKDKKNDISYAKYEVDLDGTEFSFFLDNQSLSIHIHNYLLPQEYQEVLAASILVGKTAGLSTEQIKTGLEKHFFLPAGRATLLKGINESLIVDSSYNASKASVLAFLNLISQVKKKTKREAIFLCGDMRELGIESQQEHEAVATEIFKTDIDYLYCVGEQTKKYIIENPSFKTSLGKLKEVKWFETSDEAGIYLKDHLPHQSIILVKGSQNTIFLEDAVKQLLLNTEDQAQLPRQSNFWLKKKTQAE